MAERKRVYRDRDGVRKTMIWDDEDPDHVTVHTEQDIEPILDSIARDREIMPNNGLNKLASRVPSFIYDRAVLEGWDENDWKKWLNGDGKAFKIWWGRL